MNLIKKGKFMDNRFMSAFLIVPDKKDSKNSFLLILTLENIMYLSFKSKKKVIKLIKLCILGLDYFCH